MKRLDNENNKRINYLSDISSIEKYYENQYELIKKGNTDLATLELVMLGNALDFTDYADKSLGIKLGFDEACVSYLDEVLDALNRGISQESLFENGNNLVTKASSYLGFLIIANIGGEWIDTESGAAVNVNGRTAYVYDFTVKRLQSGTELDAEEYYKSIKIVKQ